MTIKEVAREQIESLIEQAYREGHCDGRDLARTGRIGSEDMDWLSSDAHAHLRTIPSEPLEGR